MKLTPFLTEALELASTDKFSAVRLRALRDLYDKAPSGDKEYIAELFEVFVSLAETPEQLEALANARA